MNERDALLAAICEHPDEDTPRLMFADWLSEQGDAVSHVWADAIRAQIARAAGATEVPEPQFLQPQSARSPEIDYISTRLGVPASLGVARWERGFPMHLGGVFQRLGAAWPRLLSCVPFRCLSVVEANDDAIAELVMWPGINRLTELDLQSWVQRQDLDPLSERALLTLAGCTALAGLVSLRVDAVELTDAGASAILASPHLRSLKTLQLRQPYFATHNFATHNLSEHIRATLIATFGSDVFV